MNEKQIEYKLNNLISLRNIYFSIVVVMIGGLINLLHNITMLNGILIILGLLFSCFFFRLIYKVNETIRILIDLAGGK